MAIRLLVSDVDGTAVQYPYGKYQSTWDAIGYHGPDWDAWQDAINQYGEHPHLWGKLGERNLEILKGHLVAPILTKVLPPPYTPGFIECMQFVKEDGRGIHAGFVSGGSHFIAEYMVTSFGLDFQYSNVMHVDLDGRFSGTGTTHVFHDSKGKLVLDLQARFGVSKEETLFVGDHSNDVYGWNEAGVRVGMNLKKKELEAYVDYSFTDFFAVRDLIERSNGK